MNWKEKGGLLLLRALIWALAGALFGALFAGLYGVFRYFEYAEPVALLAAAATSGTVTAAFYGAMKVALLGTMTGVLTTVGYLIAFSHPERMLPVMTAAAAAGVVTGSLYAAAAEMPQRPLGQALTGLIAGLLGGVGLAGVQRFYSLELDFVAVSGIAVVMVGLLFIFLVQRVSVRCARWVPVQLSSPAVAAVIGAVVAGSMWLIGSTTSMGLGVAEKASIDAMLAQVPSGLLGGGLGGGLAGILLLLFGVDWRVGRI